VYSTADRIRAAPRRGCNVSVQTKDVKYASTLHP
jgi:hypothetical protein